MKAIIHIPDEVNCIVSNIRPTHITALYDQFGYMIESARFSPKFQLGVWDGKIRFFKKTGKTYQYLLKQIIPQLLKWNYQIEIKDSRTTPYFSPPTKIDNTFLSHIQINDQPWIMRDYQVELVNSLIENNGGIAIAGTGAGKTSCCIALSLAYEQSSKCRSMVIVPDKSLTNQTRKEYEQFGLDVGEYSGTTKDLKHQHVISTWQALQHNPSIVQDFQVVIVDECHNLRGKTLQMIMNEYGNQIPYRFGVTATLPTDKTELLSIHTTLGDVQYEIPAHKLIAEGHLATVDIAILQTNIDVTPEYELYLEEIAEDPDFTGKPLTYTRFKNSMFPDWNSEKTYLQKHKKRTQWISDHLFALSQQKKGNVLCLVNGIAYGKKLAEMTDGAVFLHGQHKATVRQEIYDLFEHEDNMLVIASAQIAAVGLNIKRIFNLVYIDFGKTFIRTIQSIGRGLRKTNDKQHINVTDICNDFKFGKTHLRKRIAYYNEQHYPHSKKIIKIDADT